MIHLIFDLLALLASAATGYAFSRSQGLQRPLPLRDTARYHAYLLSLLLGLSAGSLLFGSLNLYLSDQPGLAKSILGGLFGAIVAAELFKFFLGIRQSTGFLFVPGLAVLIGVGRIGCFLTGLPDYTHGTPTDLPIAVDFGDGIPRHPVQLYESAAMFAFLALLLASWSRHRQGWIDRGFHLFILYYASQRFIWKFLKPYPTLFLGLNLFHWLCLALIGYALWMLKAHHREQREHRIC
jgi:prolipoprotein diacylglyceryltransferase